MKLHIVGLLVLVLMSAAACKSADGKFELRLEDDYSILTIALDEKDVSDILTGVLTGGDQPLMRQAQVELRPGEVFVTGDVNDGKGGVVPGTLSVEIWAQDGNLQAAVTAFSFAGFDADASVIDNFNRQLAEGLAKAAEQDDSNSEITDITITDLRLSFTIRTPLNTPQPQ